MRSCSKTESKVRGTNHINVNPIMPPAIVKRPEFFYFAPLFISTELFCTTSFFSPILCFIVSKDWIGDTRKVRGSSSRTTPYNAISCVRFLVCNERIERIDLFELPSKLTSILWEPEFILPSLYLFHVLQECNCGRIESSVFYF